MLLQQLIQGLITALICLFISLIYFFLKYYYNNRRRKRGKRSKDPIKTLSKLIFEYWDNGDLAVKQALGSYMSFISSNDKPEKIADEIYNYILTLRVKLAGFPYQIWRTNFVKRFQNVFDQILKIKAEKLEGIYTEEKELRRKYHENGQFKDSLSRVEIDNIYKEKDNFEKRKESVEKDFWETHDFLKSFGFNTWGDESYKVYLLLKPSLDF